jgi:hypothetical protein
LPSDHWHWDDQLSGEVTSSVRANKDVNARNTDMIFMASDDHGLRVNLVREKLPWSMPLDQKFVDGFEKGLSKSGQFVKRGGRFATFQGLPCYRFEGTIGDRQTVVGKVFLANRCSYVLMVGGDGPAGQEADHDAIMNGFAFLEPPLPPSADPSYDHIAYWAGRLVGACITAFIVLLVLRWIASRKHKGLSTESARAQYEKGMKGLGNGLIALGIMAGLVAAVLGLTTERGLALGHALMLVLAIAAIEIGLGLLARRLHAWVNHLIAIFSWVMLALNFVVVASDQAGSRPESAGSWFAILITAALLYYSIKNILILRNLRAAGLGP